MAHIDERQRREMGEAKIEMLEAAGYVWQQTLPGHFWHPQTGDSIDYPTVLNATFTELGARVAKGKP